MSTSTSDSFSNYKPNSNGLTCLSGGQTKKRPLKNKRVNIRMTEDDILALKERAIDEGLPYQTLMYSVLKKFLSGRLVVAKV